MPMLYYELDIPRICTALADWIACALYLQYLPPRYGGWKRGAVYGGMLLLLAVYLIVTDGHDGMVFNVLYAGSVGLMALFYRLASKGDWNQCVFFCARSVVLAGFAASLTWQMYVYFARDVAVLQGLFALCLFVAAGYAVIFGVVCGMDRGRRSMNNIDFQVTSQTALSTAVIAAAIYVLSSISYTGVDTPFTASGRMEIYAARTVVYFGGVALLMAYHSQICDLMIQREADALRNMLHLQYENYKMRQESVELINRKYHDLKHQIAILRSESVNGRTQILDQMEQEIKAYEANNDTGNKVLDTVLSGKSLSCTAQQIQLTCVADGTAIGFMDVMDISNLFGNALDNAIESVAKISDPQRRLIHLSVSRQKGFAAIRIENCYEGDLKFERGFPLTTKRDVQNHGFGLKSIQATARKYGGSVTVSTQEGWFVLRVLLPLKE